MRPLPSGLPAADADHLTTALAEYLSLDDLKVIAEADHARDVDRHLAALRCLVEADQHTRGVPIAERWMSLKWHPIEVLELTRWDEPPHDPCWERRHWRRAFACAALLRASGENQRHVWGQNSSLAGLIDSLDALAGMPLARSKREHAEGLVEAAAGCLAWLIPRVSPGEVAEAAFFGLGLLWFALALDVADTALVALADWIMIAEDEAVALWREDLEASTSRRWLLDSTRYGQRRELWREIGRRLPNRLLKRHGPAVVEAVELIAAMIADRRTA